MSRGRGGAPSYGVDGGHDGRYTRDGEAPASVPLETLNSCEDMAYLKISIVSRVSPWGEVPCESFLDGVDSRTVRRLLALLPRNLDLSSHTLWRLSLVLPGRRAFHNRDRRAFHRRGSSSSSSSASVLSPMLPRTLDLCSLILRRPFALPPWPLGVPRSFKVS
jgi:hypothetical protein